MDSTKSCLSFEKQHPVQSCPWCWNSAVDRVLKLLDSDGQTSNLKLPFRGSAWPCHVTLDSTANMMQVWFCKEKSNSSLLLGFFGKISSCIEMLWVRKWVSRSCWPCSVEFIHSPLAVRLAGVPLIQMSTWPTGSCYIMLFSVFPKVGESICVCGRRICEISVEFWDICACLFVWELVTSALTDSFTVGRPSVHRVNLQKDKWISGNRRKGQR